MAESQSKIDAAAEKAFAEAAEKKTNGAVNTKTVEKAVAATKPTEAESESVAKTVETTDKPKPAIAKAPVSAKKVAAKRTKRKPVSKPAIAKKSAQKTTAGKAAVAPNTSKMKDKIMATAKTAKNNDYTAKAKEMAADVQTRAKAAYEKGAELTSEVVEFQKGNLEAFVESGKILASGMQDMGRTYVEDAKGAVEVVQDDVKKMAAVKSPTELFQLQGEIARRNFDTMVSAASKNTEAMLKLANEAFAPVSSRMSLAAEKVRKAA